MSGATGRIERMATKRSYGDACGVARGLDVVGERWALLVARELVLGPKRFTDLQAGLPSASPNVLAQRLRELESAGVVRRATLPPPAASQVYELTEWGADLGPMLAQLGAWGARSPTPPAGPMSVDSHVLALPALFDSEAAEGFGGTFGLRFGQDSFEVRVGDGQLELARGEADDADAVLTTDLHTFRALLWEGLRPAEAKSSGAAEIEGDVKALARFLRLFPAPTPAVT